MKDGVGSGGLFGAVMPSSVAVKVTDKKLGGSIRSVSVDGSTALLLKVFKITGLGRERDKGGGCVVKSSDTSSGSSGS